MSEKRCNRGRECCFVHMGLEATSGRHYACYPPPFDARGRPRGVPETWLEPSQDPEMRTQSVKSDMAGAATLGKTAAERAKSAGISKVVFDRGGFRFHGRIKAVADSAREAGLEF